MVWPLYTHKRTHMHTHTHTHVHAHTHKTRRHKMLIPPVTHPFSFPLQPHKHVLWATNTNTHTHTSPRYNMSSHDLHSTFPICIQTKGWSLSVGVHKHPLTDKQAGEGSLCSSGPCPSCGSVLQPWNTVCHNGSWAVQSHANPHEDHKPHHCLGPYLWLHLVGDCLPRSWNILKLLFDFSHTLNTEDLLTNGKQETRAAADASYHSSRRTREGNGCSGCIWWRMTPTIKMCSI